MDVIKFLGASVSNFNITLGKGAQPSELTVTLVEDFKDGDRFNPPAVGTPLLFEAGDDCFFAGFFHAWVKKTAPDGETYEVRVSDPRELLSGTQVILKNYTGHTGGLPNLLNVYAHLKDNNFTDFNDAGVPWRNVLTAINNISGNNVYYGQYTFNVRLQNLPSIPDYYRIAGDQISYLDLISELYEAANYDFQVSMDATNIINVIGVSRAAQSTIRDAIGQFVNSVEGAAAKEIGEELRLDTSNRFILGGKVRQFYYQASNIYSDEVKAGTKTVPTYNKERHSELILENATQDEVDAAIRAGLDDVYSFKDFDKTALNNGRFNLYRISWTSKKSDVEISTPAQVVVASDNNIWPYWGEDYNGNLVIGEGYNDDHTFNANIYDLGISYRGIKQDDYLTNVAELRAAGESRDAWESFINMASYTKFKIDGTGSKIGFVYKPTNFNDDDSITDELLLKIVNLKKVAKEKHIFDPLLTQFNMFPTLRKDVEDAWIAYEVSKRKPMAVWDKKSYINNLTFSEILNAFYDINIKNVSEYNLFVTYRHNDVVNIHYGKSLILGLSDYLSGDMLGKLLDQSTALSNVDIQGLIHAVNPSVRALEAKADRDFMLDRLHRKLNDLFNNNYGRKFIVTIPFNVSVTDGDVTKIETTLMPTDSAPIDESVASSYIQEGILPTYYNKFLTEDGKVYPYIRADLSLKFIRNNPTTEQPEYRFARLDVGGFSDDAYVYDPDGSAIFVKCEVQEKLGFVNRELLYGPKAIIELPSQLKYLEEETDGGHDGLLTQFVSAILDSRQADNDPNANIFTPDIEIINDIISKFGGEAMFFGSQAVLAYPVMAAIPLESQVQRYGPFFYANIPGKVDLLIDENITPWTHGSYTNMAGAAYAQIIDAVSAQYSSQTGSVTVPGLPSLNIGNPIISDGPNITQIAVTVSDAGITTTYRMESFTNRFGKLAQQYVKIFENTRRQLNYVRARLANREFYTPRRDVISKQEMKNFRPHRLLGHTSQGVIGADVGENGYTVFSMPHYNFNQMAGQGDYQNKAFVSLNGLFAPIAFTPTHEGNLPKFKDVDVDDGDFDTITAQRLNPYDNGDVSPASVIARGDSVEDYQTLVDPNRDVRGIGLKLPIAAAGWGYDTDEKPVPYKRIAAVGTEGSDDYVPAHDGFDDDYKTDMSKWKVGPIDFRWDEERGVWAAGGGGNKAKLVTIIEPSGKTYDEVIEIVNTGAVQPEGEWSLVNNYWKAEDADGNELYVKNIRRNVVPELQFIAWKIGDDWLIDNQLSFLGGQ